MTGASLAALAPAPATRGAAGPLRALVLADMAALDAAGPAWRALESRAAAQCLFQSHAHTMIWARNYLVGSGTALHVVMLYDGDDLGLVLPLCITTTMGVRIARVTGYPIAQYADALADRPADASCFAAIVQSLRDARVDAVALDGIRADSTLHRLVAARGLKPGNARVAPFVDLARFPDHDSFVRERSRGLGKKLRARRRQLEGNGELRFDILSGGLPARQALAGGLHLKREWLIQRGAMSTTFLDPAANACLLDLAEHVPGALVFQLRLNGATAAIRLGFEHRGTFFSYLSAYEESLAQYSPGKLLMNLTLASVRTRGGAMVDLFPPASENKAIWCDRDIAVADYVLALTLKGRVHAVLFQQKLRPLLRWGYYRLPDAVRQTFARRLLRR
ncbi:GNAT family N-acetyltransferase [uncultured Devosia sp.]|uniref:GNAT family N-acetyltransferase n=1 Tax=uncultured Devosia sp. TaxID=211434 RepID=UPI0035CC240C